MCNLGEILELEAIKSERVRNIKSIMTKLKMSFKEAIAFLEIPEDEEKEMYGLSSNATVVFDPKISNISFHLRDLLYDFFGIQQLFKMSYAIAKKQ